MLDYLHAQLKKTYQALGLAKDEPSRPGYRPATVDTRHDQYPRFSDELPYQYYDEDRQLFFNTHNAGLLYVIQPLTGANEALAEQLDAILRSKISDTFTLHMIQVKHNQVAPQIDRFAAQFQREELQQLAILGDSLEDYYKHAAKQGFKTRDGIQARLSQTDVYVVIDQATSRRSEAEIQIAFDQFKIGFEAALTASSIGFRACDAVDFLHLMQFYLQHETQRIYPRAVEYDDSTLLKYQLMNHAFSLEVDDKQKDHLLLNGDQEAGKDFTTAISVLTLDQMPSHFKLWDNANNTANVFQPDYMIPCNHLISVTYRVDEQGKALGKANRKTRSLNKKAKSDYALLVAGTEEQAGQWKSFRDDLSQQKTRSCKMLYNVILFSDPTQRQQDVESAINTFAVNGLKLAVCKRMQMPYFLASMPFLFSGHLEKDFALPTMMHHISSWNAVQYFPLLSDWRGQRDGVLLPSVRGQLALVDPFSDYFGTNYNVAVTGTTGAGKSFLMQMMMLSTLFDGGAVYIIDIGGSYRKLCEALGGVYLEYHNLAMNPFTHVDNIHDHIDDLIELFELLACPKRGASDEDSSALRAAILAAFDAHQQATLIDHVKDALDSLYDPKRYPTAMTLASNIEKYTSQAEHGKAFNAPSALDPTSRFIVVDLQEIKDKKNLIAPALLSVFSQFKKRIYQSDRSVKKLCLVDEAWKFFEGDPRAIAFLVEGFRTGRRHKASFITVTQGVNDYFKFKEATQLWENAALKMVLLQDETTLTQFNQTHQLFSEYEMTLLKKFPEAKKTGYSQVHLRGGRVHTFQRLFVDPFTLVLLSSDGADYAAVSALQAQGVPLLDAVNQVARAHYGDMYHE